MYRSPAVMNVFRSVFVAVVLTMVPGFAAAQKSKGAAPTAPAKSAATQAKGQAPAARQSSTPAQHVNPAHAARTAPDDAGPSKPVQHGNRGEGAQGKGGGGSVGQGGSGGKGGGGSVGQGGSGGKGGGSSSGHSGPGPNGLSDGHTPVRFQPPAGSKKTSDGKGGNTYSTEDGKQFHTNAQGKLDSARTPQGTEAKFGANGKPTLIRTPGGMSVTRGGDGSRRIESKRADGARVISDGRHRGFVEHTFARGGRTYISRTYVVNGRSYARVYNAYYYHGVYFAGYVPAYYYGLAFYGWAYDPWAAPVAWGWGWGAAPWYGFYDGYFAPYAVYPGPAFWLTDYLLAANLQAAYAAQQSAGGTATEDSSQPDTTSNNADAVTLTPEVKKAIAEEVKVELAAEKAEAGSSTTSSASSSAPQEEVPAALDPKRTVFVVSSTVSGQMDDGQACSLTGGDVLTRVKNTPDPNQNVQVLVTTAKSEDCATGTQVAVSIQDLQDMYNAFREKMDAGLGEMAKDQGTKGMPKARGTTPRTNSAAQGAEADPQAAADLKSQQNEADKAENDVNQTTNETTSGSNRLPTGLNVMGTITQ